MRNKHLYRSPYHQRQKFEDNFNIKGVWVANAILIGALIGGFFL